MNSEGVEYNDIRRLQLSYPLLHLLLHGLVGIHQRLLVYYDFRCICSWSANPGCDGC